jgi:hypothetical protein
MERNRVLLLEDIVDVDLEEKLDQFLFLEVLEDIAFLSVDKDFAEESNEL